jgi:hypothetical protein
MECVGDMVVVATADFRQIRTNRIGERRWMVFRSIVEQQQQ